MSLIAFLATAAIQAAQTPTPSDLSRVFTKGEKVAYKILSHITAEQRLGLLDTFIPSDLDINYNFTTVVTDMKGDGIAVMHYQRPTMTEVIGETAESGPISKTLNIDLDYVLSVSPINQILEEKDISKHPDHRAAIGSNFIGFRQAQDARSFFAPFIEDVHRLALFIGGVQDSLDFAPKLPFQPVKPGSHWNATVGFEPQALKGSDGKSAIQRLDYVYTYLGPVTTDGKKVLRVEAKLDFKSDLAQYLKQVISKNGGETNVDKLPLQFQSTIDFDLDPVSHDTLHAEGTTKGGYQVFLSDETSRAVEEEKFSGKTTIELIGKRTVGAASPS